MAEAGPEWKDGRLAANLQKRDTNLGELARASGKGPGVLRREKQLLFRILAETFAANMLFGGVLPIWAWIGQISACRKRGLRGRE